MTDSTHVTILRRMTRSAEKGAVENPLTSSRAVRLALTKAADEAVGLVLTVSSVSEDADDLDAMLAGLPAGLMLVGLYRAGKLAGLIALDMELRAAVLEMQTMGVLINRPAQQRTPTRTDKSMCDPLFAAFLSAFPASVAGSPLEGWCDGVIHGDRIENQRAAGLLLDDCEYRSVQMSVDLGIADRQGVLVLALPMTTAPQKSAPVAPPRPDWGAALQARVENAPATLTAVLRRFPLSIAAAQSLYVGQVLPLPGCTVHSVRMVSADGRDVGAAKLGQSGGMRAIRIEAAPPAGLTDLPTPKGARDAAGGVAVDPTPLAVTSGAGAQDLLGTADAAVSNDDLDGFAPMADAFEGQDA